MVSRRVTDWCALACVIAGLAIMMGGYVHAQMETSVAVNTQRISEHERRLQALEDRNTKIDFMLYGLFLNLGATGFQIASQSKRRREG